jgi:hypothetical protein
MNERAHIEALLNAINAHPRALRRHTGEWHVAGDAGSIFVDGSGYRIVTRGLPGVQCRSLHGEYIVLDVVAEFE